MRTTTMAAAAACALLAACAGTTSSTAPAASGRGWIAVSANDGKSVLDNGVSKNPHLADYKIPTSLDAPGITGVLLESGGGLGPFGAKGLGEPAMTPSIAAVANAVSNALGARVTDLPITAERVLARLRATTA